MDQREHIARQAAAAVDEVIEHQERGESADQVTVAVMRMNLRAALDAGIHPDELKQYRRTTPQH